MREAGRHHLVILYTLDANDMRWSQGNEGDHFYTYLKDAFDQLFEEGRVAPKMMTVREANLPTPRSRKSPSPPNLPLRFPRAVAHMFGSTKMEIIVFSVRLRLPSNTPQTAHTCGLCFVTPAGMHPLLSLRCAGTCLSAMRDPHALWPCYHGHGAGTHGTDCLSGGAALPHCRSARPRKGTCPLPGLCQQQTRGLGLPSRGHCPALAGKPPATSDCQAIGH